VTYFKVAPWHFPEKRRKMLKTISQLHVTESKARSCEYKADMVRIQRPVSVGVTLSIFLAFLYLSSGTLITLVSIYNSYMHVYFCPCDYGACNNTKQVLNINILS
jgi:hypothetical protein